MAEVTQFHKRHAGLSTPLHLALADLSFPVVLTTTHDACMANAFRQSGKQPNLAWYNFQVESTQTGQNGSEQQPTLFHLLGHPQEPQSLALTETDLLDYLGSLLKGSLILPTWLTALVRDKNVAFLFLGFGFVHWYWRLLLHHLLADRRLGKRSFALEEGEFFNREEKERTVLFFKESHFIDFHQHPTDFAEELKRRYQAAQPPPPPTTLPADAPKVFLSYASEDAVRAMEICKKLEQRGINIWIDRQDLRGGDNWPQVLVQVIKKQVDYLVLLNSRNLQQRDKSVVSQEIEEALKQQNQRSLHGRKFLIPAKIDDCPKFASLEDFHEEDLSQNLDSGLDRLKQAIMADWQKRSEKKI